MHALLVYAFRWLSGTSSLRIANIFKDFLVDYEVLHTNDKVPDIGVDLMLSITSLISLAS